MLSQNETSRVDFAPVPVVSFSPLVLPAPGRAVDLQMKVSAPATGDKLPILLFSHGHGRSNFLSSLLGNAPLIDFYAAQGFVVIQPTHLSSRTLNLDPNGPEGPLFWKSRAEDMKRILDHLDTIESSVPGLSGRLDKDRIAIAGLSLGGHTAAMLLGMTVTDPNDGKEVDLSDSRIKTGVVMVAPGRGEDLAAFASEHYPVFKHNDFSKMKTQALVVVGDKDVNPMFSARADWRSDAYFLSPYPKSLLTIFGGEHLLGGISGYDAAETTDENPERVKAVQKYTSAYLRTALYAEDVSWENAKKDLQEDPDPKAKIESK